MVAYVKLYDLTLLTNVVKLLSEGTRIFGGPLRTYARRNRTVMTNRSKVTLAVSH